MRPSALVYEALSSRSKNYTPHFQCRTTSLLLLLLLYYYCFTSADLALNELEHKGSALLLLLLLYYCYYCFTTKTWRSMSLNIRRSMSWNWNIIYIYIYIYIYTHTHTYTDLALKELEHKGSRLYFQCRKCPERVGDIQRVKLS